MNLMEFSIQIDRLKNAFGVKNFDTERSDLIWKEVRHQVQTWMVRVCDEFISTRPFNSPPLPKDFSEKMSSDRNDAWKREKEVHRQEATDFFSGDVFHDDEKKMMFRTILDRTNGLVPDADWNKFLSLIRGKS